MGCLSTTQLSCGGLVALVAALTMEYTTAFLTAPQIAGANTSGYQSDGGYDAATHTSQGNLSIPHSSMI